MFTGSHTMYYPAVLKFCRFLLLFVVNATWNFLLTLRSIMKSVQDLRERRSVLQHMNHGGVAKGKTVLVTTGRQAKTLHVVRALKEVGAKVIVTDYDRISASALSLACDKFIVLPPIRTDHTQAWIRNFRDILLENQVDMVLPVSTINEVLIIGLAQQQLAAELPHIKWLCPDLNVALQLDDRSQFAAFCDKFGVRTPEHGLLTSSENILRIADRFMDGIILKRIESSVNRREEIVRIKRGEAIPEYVTPTPADPWQWQRFVSGPESSVWYVCVDGKVTFSSCYHSESDLVNFDPAYVPEDLDEPLRELITGLRLNGQFAFDFIRDEKSGLHFVIECNPRASSILETVSKTPLWGEAFFGNDVTKRTVYDSVGFIYHRNCWPWSNRSEGYYNATDPLPLLGAEIVWPLHAIATKGLSEKLFQKIDVNICKIIVDGPSAGRDLAHYRGKLYMEQITVVLQSLKHMDTLLLDVSVPQARMIIDECRSFNTRVVLLRHENALVPENLNDVGEVIELPDGKISEELLQTHMRGETRILLGADLSKSTGSSSSISYRIVRPGHTWSPKYEIPLRKLRVLHVMGSCANDFYDTLSTTYGYKCLANVGTDGRFEHFVAHISPSGRWSVSPYIDDDHNREEDMISAGEALVKIESMGIDVVVPHMFDYEGMTSYRSLFNILNIPMVGCTADALALSTNKSRTNACARVAGIQVPDFEVLRMGEKPEMSLPFVVKPSEEDNSQGICVVKEEKDVENALNEAFRFCDEVLCEQFIPPGRELRVGLVEKGDGSLDMLPIIEYFVSEKDPIRTKDHKVNTNASGSVQGIAGTAPGGSRLPAEVDDVLKEMLYRMLSKAHRVLGCRDYSIYDIRVDPCGEPYMLETCLYCSFAESSVLVKMQASDGVSTSQLFERLCEKALTRRTLGDECGQSVGMRIRH